MMLCILAFERGALFFKTREGRDDMSSSARKIVNEKPKGRRTPAQKGRTRPGRATVQEPRSEIRATEPLGTSIRFATLRAFLMYAKPLFEYVPSVKDWSGMGLDLDVYAEYAWSDTSEGLPLRAEIDARVMLLRKAGIPTDEQGRVPGIVFPFRLPDTQDLPERLDWEWFQRAVAKRDRPPIAVIMPLPALLAVTHPVSEEVCSELYPFWMRAAALLLASRLGHRESHAGEIELVEANGEPQGMFFQGKYAFLLDPQQAACRV